MKIQIQDLGFAYNGNPTLSDLTLNLEDGNVLVLVGPNGSGKSTLLKLISGILKHQTGAILVDGKEVLSFSARELAKMIGVLEQEHQASFEFSVRELIEWGRTPHLGRLERLSDADEEAVRRAIETTGLTDLASRSISRLSGGERQRVFLAMALAQEPEVLLLDEPTAHLDLKYQVEILDLTRDLAHQGITVVVAIHDLNLASRIADQMAFISEGKLVALGSPRELLKPELIEHVWGIKTRILHEADGPWVLPELS